MNPNEFATKIRQKYPGAYDHVDDVTLSKKIVDKYPEYSNQVSFENPSMLSRGWDALQKPEQLSRQGLQQIAQFIPEGKITGNKFGDIARGTPRIIADTIAEAAPGFVSRGSIVAGAAAPVIGGLAKAASPIAESVAGGLEDWAGIKPSGSLMGALRDPSLIFSKGTKSAKPFYKAAEKEIPKGSSIFSGMYKPEQIVDKARETLDKGGKLEPSEALTYRKAVDILSKSGRYVKDELFSMRQEADQIAKQSENIAQADPLHKRGMMASSLRSLAPKNVGGRFSPFKVGEALALAHMGPLGKVATVMFSPLALGLGATALGAAGRVASNPSASITAQQLLNFLRNSNTQQ